MKTPNKEGSEAVLKYIDGLPGWSQNICLQLRQIILDADASLVESWKWGPNYSSNGMVCGYNAFQKHIKLTFFNGSAMKDGKKAFNHCVDNEFSRSIKYTNEKEIDKALLTSYIKESIRVNQNGFKRAIANKQVEVPADLQKALEKNRSAHLFFNNLTYGYKKDFVEYVTSAKLEKTRLDRISKVVSHTSEGRRLNDKYKAG
jgi:hypothetical protein